MRKSLKFCIPCLFAVAVICTAAPTTNLLRNGSFEAGRTGWMLDSKPSGASFEVREDEYAVEGNRIAAVRISEACALATLAGEWVPMQAGQDYTFRISLRCDTPQTEVVLSVWSWAEAGGKWNQKTESSRRVTLSSDWQTVDLVANLDPARSGKYQVQIQLGSPCTLYMDDASLVEGRNPVSDQIVRASFDAGLECTQSGSLFDTSETPGATARIYNRADTPLNAELRAVLTDLDDTPVWSSSEPLWVEPGSTVNKDLRPPVSKRGYYRLKTKIISSNEVQACELAFAVIDKNKEKPNPDSWFGVDMASHNLDRQLQRARDIGVSHIRVHESLNWKRIETERGNFKWPEAADYSAYRDAGFEVLVYIDGIWQGTPDWAKDLSAVALMECYSDFCARCAEHYAGIIDQFEIINEPWSHIGSQEYSDILRKTYPKIKAEAPGTTVAAVTGYSGPQVDFIRKIIRTDALSSMDVFTLHPYPRPARPEPSLIEMLDQTSEWLNEADWSGPVWITETGWTTPGREPLPTRIPRPAARDNTELERAMYMVRSYILSIAHGIDRLYWFYFSGDNNFYYSYDMFECDSNDSVMKTVPVYAAMTSRLKGYRFEKTLCEGNGGIYAYLFNDSSDRQIVAWNSGTAETGMLLSEPAEAMQLYDMTGNPCPQPQQQPGVRFVSLTGQPVYIEFKNTDTIPRILSPVQIQTTQENTTIEGTLSISNVFPDACNAIVQLTAPETAHLQTDSVITAALKAGESQLIPFTFNIDDQETAVADDVAAKVILKTNGNEYALQISHPFLYAKPLPPVPADIQVTGSDYTSIRLEPGPLWQPNLIRSHSGSVLLYRLIKGEVPKKAFVEYRIPAEYEGSYRMRLACTPLEPGTIGWSINNEPKQFHFEQDGASWIYSTHPANWWRFECAWHDLGIVHLNRGDNTLRINFNNPQERDYGYMALDVISFTVADQ